MVFAPTHPHARSAPAQPPAEHTAHTAIDYVYHDDYIKKKKKKKKKTGSHLGVENSHIGRQRKHPELS